MIKKSTLLVTLFLTLSLTACGGSGEASVPTPPPVEPIPEPIQPENARTGVYQGNFKSRYSPYNTNWAMSGANILINPSGNFYARTPFNFVYGTYKDEAYYDLKSYSLTPCGECEFNEADGKGWLTLYEQGQVYISTDSPLTGAVLHDSQWLDFDFQGLEKESNSPANLVMFSNNYSDGYGTTSFAIDIDGGFTGSDKIGCVFNGVVDVPYENVNIYNLTISVSNCEFGGEYTGVATLSDRYIEIYINNDENFYYNRLLK